MQNELPTNDATGIESSSQPEFTGNSPMRSRLLYLWPLAVLGLLSIVLLLQPGAKYTVDGDARCSLKLQSIGNSLRRYREDHGTFPPFSVGDEEDNLTPSWRVLLLPYVDHSFYSSEYDFSKPWDEENRRLLKEIPSVFVCPEGGQRGSGETSYVAVVGQGTASPRHEGNGIRTLKGNAATTAIIIEIQNSGIGWTENRDLSINELKQILRSSSGFPTPHGKGFNVLFADGSVRGVKVSIPDDALLNLFSPSPTKDLPQDYLCDPFR